MRNLNRLTLLFLLATSFTFSQTTDSRHAKRASKKPVTQAQRSAASPAEKPEVEEKVNAILVKMTLEEKIDMLGGVQGFFIPGNDRVGIKKVKMADGPMGVRNFGFSTAYPAGIGLAASWNAALAKRIGEGIGRDARAKGVNILLGPGLNIYRAPMNGRNFEYFGEDPYLASRMSVGYVQGVQSQGVMTTAKHFMGNNSEYDRHNTNSEIDERTMREIYLPAFEAAVREGHTAAIMDSYNLVDGEHASQSGFLNNQIAKKDWGFDGIMMSDWDATYDAVGAANGGLDLEMPSGKFLNKKNLLPAVKDGRVSVATIDDKVRRILRKSIEFGFYDRDQQDLNISRFNPESKRTALEGARESIVLLKNDSNVLPLNRDVVKTVAVIGPGAYPAVPAGGGSARVEPFTAVSYLQGISDVGGKVKILYDRGIPEEDELTWRSDFSTEAKDGERGLKAEYFSTPDFSGKAETRVDPRVFIQGGSRNISVRWSGYYIPQTSGNYRWLTRATGMDSYKLFVNDKLALEQEPREGQVPKSADMQMEAGTAYKVRYEYVEFPGWLGSSASLAVLPAADLVTEQAKKIAQMADAAVVFVGYDAASESEGSDRDFRLPPNQDDLIQAVAQANKKTIVVITSGGGVEMTRWVDQVPGIIQGWYSGQEGGTALAQIVFGEVNPSGKLPATFERRWEDNPAHDSYYSNDGGVNVKYKEGVFVGYRGYEKSGTKPLFPFGHGLSYTTFAYKNLGIEPKAPKAGENVTVSFDVTNTGKVAGAEAAQLYLGNPGASVPRPLKELKGFTKVMLQPGQTKHVTLTLNPRAMSFYDLAGKAWKQERGKFTVYVGHSSAQIDLTGEYSVAAK